MARLVSGTNLRRQINDLGFERCNSRAFGKDHFGRFSAGFALGFSLLATGLGGGERLLFDTTLVDNPLHRFGVVAGLVEFRGDLACFIRLLLSCQSGTE